MDRNVYKGETDSAELLTPRVDRTNPGYPTIEPYAPRPEDIVPVGDGSVVDALKKSIPYLDGAAGAAARNQLDAERKRGK